MENSGKGWKLLVLGIVLVAVDQVIKVLVKTGMGLGEQIYVLGDWFRLCFVENEGMAFGLKWGGGAGKFLLSLFRILLFGGLVWWIRSLIRKGAPTGVLAGLTLITAGAFGNIIDSLLYGVIWDYAPVMFGKVVDMFYFPLIHNAAGEVVFFQPVFNFADSCVTVGAFYLILFHWRFFAADSPSKDA